MFSFYNLFLKFCTFLISRSYCWIKILLITWNVWYSAKLWTSCRIKNKVSENEDLTWFLTEHFVGWFVFALRSFECFFFMLLFPIDLQLTLSTWNFSTYLDIYNCHSVREIFQLIRIFPHSDWIRKNGPEKLRILIFSRSVIDFGFRKK